MMEDFHRGVLNLSRINYEMIMLIPKLKEVANIRHRPIWLLNVFTSYLLKFWLLD
jgi:hypothetical protein